MFQQVARHADRCSMQECIYISGLTLLWGCYPQPCEQIMWTTSRRGIAPTATGSLFWFFCAAGSGLMSDAYSSPSTGYFCCVNDLAGMCEGCPQACQHFMGTSFGKRPLKPSTPKPPLPPATAPAKPHPACRANAAAKSRSTSSHLSPQAPSTFHRDRESRCPT